MSVEGDAGSIAVLRAVVDLIQRHRVDLQEVLRSYGVVEDELVVSRRDYHGLFPWCPRCGCTVTAERGNPRKWASEPCEECAREMGWEPEVDDALGIIRRSVTVYANRRRRREEGCASADMCVTVEVDTRWWSGVLWSYREARRSGCNQAFARSLVFSTLKSVTR